MTAKDLEHIDNLIKQLNGLPKIVELRIKGKWEVINQSEQDLLFQTYKDLDDLLNDTLAFINVKFPNRDDLKQHWNRIDFDPKLSNFKVETNSPELIRSSWIEGIQLFESLLKNLRREIVLLIDNSATLAEVNNKKVTLKSKWERSHKIALASFFVAIAVLIFGNNLYDRFSKSSIAQSSNDSNEIKMHSIDTTVVVKELPYLENYPIIDNGLYIKYYYNSLIFGGVNVDSIKINARTISSEQIEIKTEKEKGFLSMDITNQPFIEFEYKGNYYSISLVGRHYQFVMTLKEIANPTLTLKEYDRL